MRHALSAVCTLLLLAAPLGVAHTAETLDEKVYDPSQRHPAGEAPAVTPDVRVTPGQTGPGDTIIVVPGTQGQTPPEQTVPGQTIPGKSIPGQAIPAPDGSSPRVLVPESVSPESLRPETIRPETIRPDAAQPDTLLREAPAIVTSPTAPATTVPLPELPKAPGREKKDVIVTPVTPATPGGRTTTQSPSAPSAPSAKDRVLLTPADFLPRTPNTPEKAQPSRDVKPDSKKDMKPAPKTDGKPDPKKDGKPDSAKDAKPDPPKDGKPNPKKDTKPAPKKDAPKPAAEKKKGDVLSIPPDAGKTGKKDFLEGCWKGRVTGNDGRDVRDNMGSRVCFDANGNGKHALYDPVKKETCVGSAKGVVSGDNLLRVDYDKMQCPSGKTWYPQGDRYMTCRDAGTGAQCSWYFGGKPDVGVRFYRD